MRYRDVSGVRRLETTNTEDWDEAQRRLRERLQARDNRTLEVVRRGEQLIFEDWAHIFMETWKITRSRRSAPRRPTKQMSAQ
jgi:hypothetical protein